MKWNIWLKNPDGSKGEWQGTIFGGSAEEAITNFQKDFRETRELIAEERDDGPQGPI